MQNLPKALAFDLDGTLAPSKSHIETVMEHMLEEILKHFPVAVVSGASKEQFDSQFLKYFPKTEKDFNHLYLFAENGASLIVYKKGEWTVEYDYRFTDEESKEVIGALNAIANKYGLSSEQARGQGYGELIENRGAQVTLSALGQKAPLELKEKWDPKHEIREKILSDLKPLLPGCEIRIGGSTSIDITKKGINKAMAVNTFLKILGIAKENLIYFGDATYPGGNDEIVKETGVECRQVDNPGQTISALRDIISLYENTERHSSVG